MKVFGLLFMFAPFLAGCATHYGTVNSGDFFHVTKISELAGVYKNKGDWGGSGTLAEILWQGRSDHKPVADYNKVDFIDVSSTANSLTVKAIQNGCAVYGKTYVLGRDFKLDYGRIIIHSEFHSLTRGGGDVLVGPSYSEVALGLDSKGNGKYKATDAGAGLAFLFLPVAGSETRDVTFERVSNTPRLYKDCHSS